MHVTTTSVPASGSSPPVRGTLRLQICWCKITRFIPARAGNTRRETCQSSRYAVHPRPCGEHPLPTWALRVTVRFIPARAGNTEFRGTGRQQPHGSSPPVRGTLTVAHVEAAGRPRPVHPRPCGEHDNSHAGSRTVDRFIPARAGNTWRASRTATSLTVHPRPCGEHLRFRHLCTLCPGSSPPVRGTRCRRRRLHGDIRFIPARAGNTDGELHGYCSACGGSSPPVRGTRPDRCYTGRLLRFIPARAGNTRRVHTNSAFWPVHPRPCGEHTYSYGIFASSIRFIPARAGNTTLTHDGRYLLRRFIPARAGNTPVQHEDRGLGWPVHPRPCGEHTCKLCGAGFARAVHPRPCGEHITPSVLSLVSSAGSSPPVRGTPILAIITPSLWAVHPRPCGEHNNPTDWRVRCHPRFIPARAGNTGPSGL